MGRDPSAATPTADLTECYADLHVHIGAADGGNPVKITASRSLTFANIAREAATRKGIELIGIVDGACTGVLADIRRLLAAGEIEERPGGGIRFGDGVTIILGAELEAVEPGGAFHTLSYFPTVAAVEAFSRSLQPHITNLQLSSQRTGLSLAQHVELTEACGGVLIPAHAFTPSFGIYSVTSRIADLLPTAAWNRLKGLELGLSADTAMADRIPELQTRTFLSNSDAHSLPRIGREHNWLRLLEPTFRELRHVLNAEAGRRVVANYGLRPELGKYHRTYCRRCDERAQAPPPVMACPGCGRDDRIVVGVRDRLEVLADDAKAEGKGRRPRYHYQVPLDFIPGIGARTIDRLIEAFGDEMTVLHRASEAVLSDVVGAARAARIIAARRGEVAIEAGGGGEYGRVR